MTTHPKYQIMNQLARIANQLHLATGACPIPGLTPSQVSTLAFLFASGQREVYQRDVENYFHLRRSTVSSMLNTLEKKEFIQRVSVSHDARLKRLILTSKGQQVSNQVAELFAQMNTLLTQDLSQEEVLTLHQILTKIETNLSHAEA